MVVQILKSVCKCQKVNREQPPHRVLYSWYGKGGVKKRFSHKLFVSWISGTQKLSPLACAAYYDLGLSYASTGRGGRSRRVGRLVISAKMLARTGCSSVFCISSYFVVVVVGMHLCRTEKTKCWWRGRTDMIWISCGIYNVTITTTITITLQGH